MKLASLYTKRWRLNHPDKARLADMRAYANRKDSMLEEYHINAYLNRIERNIIDSFIINEFKLKHR